MKSIAVIWNDTILDDCIRRLVKLLVERVNVEGVFRLRRCANSALARYHLAPAKSESLPNMD